MLARYVGPMTAPITSTRSSPMIRLRTVQPATVTEFRAVEDDPVLILAEFTDRSGRPGSRAGRQSGRWGRPAVPIEDRMTWEHSLPAHMKRRGGIGQARALGWRPSGWWRGARPRPGVRAQGAAIATTAPSGRRTVPAPPVRRRRHRARAGRAGRAPAAAPRPGTTARSGTCRHRPRLGPRRRGPATSAVEDR